MLVKPVIFISKKNGEKNERRYTSEHVNSDPLPPTVDILSIGAETF